MQTDDDGPTLGEILTAHGYTNWAHGRGGRYVTDADGHTLGPFEDAYEACVELLLIKPRPGPYSPYKAYE